MASRSTLDILVDAVKQQMADSSISFATGVKALSEHTSPPRIVFVRTGGTIDESRFGGPTDYVHTDGKTYRLKRIHDDIANIQAHVWAADEEKWERLRQRLLSAVRTVFSKASEAGDYSVDTEGPAAGHVHLDTVSGWQVFKWRLNVCETVIRAQKGDANELGPMVPVRALVTVLHQTHECSIDNDL